MELTWMAWTWPTAAFFGFIALCLIGMTIWEFAVPGDSLRRGILGLDTTRGDRLFLSLLGSAYIFLIWVAITDAPLWGALAAAVVYTVCVFRWV